MQTNFCVHVCAHPCTHTDIHMHPLRWALTESPFTDKETKAQEMVTLGPRVTWLMRDTDPSGPQKSTLTKHKHIIRSAWLKAVIRTMNKRCTGKHFWFFSFTCFIDSPGPIPELGIPINNPRCPKSIFLLQKAF